MCEVFDRACGRAARYANERGGSLALAEKFLHRCGWQGFGIEEIAFDAGEESVYLRYINQGDTYETTVLRQGSGDCSVGNWGDWLEAQENKHCEEENVVRCGHCGDYTDCDQDGNWEDETCTHCGNCVSG